MAGGFFNMHGPFPLLRTDRLTWGNVGANSRISEDEKRSRRAGKMAGFFPSNMTQKVTLWRADQGGIFAVDVTKSVTTGLFKTNKGKPVWPDFPCLLSVFLGGR